MKEAKPDRPLLDVAREAMLKPLCAHVLVTRRGMKVK
jgi:hypothetical protein